MNEKDKKISDDSIKKIMSGADKYNTSTEKEAYFEGCFSGIKAMTKLFHNVFPNTDEDSKGKDDISPTIDDYNFFQSILKKVKG